MKNNSFVFVLVIILLSITNSCLYNVNESNYIEEPIEEETYFNYTIGEEPFVFFEDAKFKTALLNNFSINIDKDNEITFVEALNYNGKIDIRDREIRSLFGIEKFENITKLDIARNNISSLDLRNNTKLKSVVTAVNPISFLYLEENILLESVVIKGIKLQHLDFSKNINLVHVKGYCNYQLEIINMKNANNEKIKHFSFSNSPALECIQVDSIGLAIDNHWSKPKDAVFSLSCSDQ